MTTKTTRYPNGNIESLINYDDAGERSGEARFFSQDSKQSLTQQYRNGNLVTASNIFKKEE